MAASLTFDSVTKRYDTTEALAGIDLTIEAGSFVALVGASGSGKSTLLKTINRLVEPTTGRVLLDGEDVTTRDATAMRRQMGYVFQRIGLFPHMRVGENIAIGPRLVGDNLSRERIGELLELVDLDPAMASRLPEELSGGQQQRVGVARALAGDPDLLLMDEPFGALDPVTRDALGTRVRDLHDRLELTTLMVTHDMAEALILADRVLVMDAGKIVADETPQALASGGGGEVSGVWTALMGLGGVLAQHVILAACAIGLGIAVALPLAVWASRSQAVSRAALGFASLVQTIPALALLALFFPILLSLRAVFGEDLPTLGFLPALLALALYALLPILRNAVTAQANLDPGVIEAADGVGMNFWQRLRLVEAPLTAPYIMAGIRTAAVWTIGAATLATTIGQPSLGDPIFAGLQTQNWSLVLAGCIASAGLAIIAACGWAVRWRSPSALQRPSSAKSTGAGTTGATRWSSGPSNSPNS